MITEGPIKITTAKINNIVKMVALKNSSLERETILEVIIAAVLSQPKNLSNLGAIKVKALKHFWQVITYSISIQIRICGSLQIQVQQNT